MKITLKVPSYSVEQGKIFLNGKALPREYHNRIAPYFYGLIYCENYRMNPIKIIREKLFPKQRKGRYAIVIKTYPEKERQWLNDKREGFIADYRDVLTLIREWKKGALEGAQFSVRTFYVG